MKQERNPSTIALLFLVLLLVGSCTTQATPYPTQKNIELSDAQVENIVRLSYPYVALYNINHKIALDSSAPISTGGWNKLVAMTTLADHTLEAIARPNNDTLYLPAMIDVRQQPMILQFPSFDSMYVSLLVSSYDHYVNIPLSTTQGDFDKPSRILFYSQRTPGYRGALIPGIDQVMEVSGDFIQTTLRVMPHANEPARLAHNRKAMQKTRLLTLSDYLVQNSVDVEFAGLKRDLDIDTEFPPFGRTDFDIFGNNLLEVMQFIFNHTTFDPESTHDQTLLEVYKTLGVEPGKAFNPKKRVQLNEQQFRNVAQKVARQELTRMGDPNFLKQVGTRIFLPKGEMDQDLLVFLSVVGPIGQPAREAVYPPVTTTDGKPMNAMYDYVVRMDANSLPPANAFWSLTLYDTKNGFFIPNDAKKYSVGENSGMKLNDQGGIEIHVSVKKPAGVPDENWLPLNRGDYGIDLLMRIYAPDLERYKSWTLPRAERVK